MSIASVSCNIGFDKRTFLTEAEWLTYRRRKPVRYIRKTKLDACEVCGEAADISNPFQNAHKIGFDLGIIQLALTPDFLDGETNIVTAHRSTCNRRAELNLEDAMRFLRLIGVRKLPEFLPDDVRLLWNLLEETG